MESITYRLKHAFPEGGVHMAVVVQRMVDARTAGGIHGLAEENEDIRVVVKTVAELEAMLLAGQIETGHTLICCYWLLRHRDRIRREWLGG